MIRCCHHQEYSINRKEKKRTRGAVWQLCKEGVRGRQGSEAEDGDQEHGLRGGLSGACINKNKKIKSFFVL